jgi:TDG/mug DNA glycosylase family protein
VDRETVDIYEQRHAEWEARRTPAFIDDARSLGARAVTGPVADLGCGTGWYAAVLPRPTVALDATHAMLLRTGELAPDALRVRGDLCALPLRAGSLRGTWARNSYVHVPSVEVPMALADLHRALGPEAPFHLTFFGGEVEGRDVFPGGDLEGRFFSTWQHQRLSDVVAGAGLRAEVNERRNEAGDVAFDVIGTRARTLADTVGPGMRLLVCGLNPSLYAADAGVGYARPGNRFWPAALAAGIVERDRDAQHALHAHGIGMTDVVKRATVSADELSHAEYRTGFARVERLVRWLRPRAICFVGLAGWRAAVDRGARAGVQDRDIGGVPVYLMPSTSGANAHARLDELVEHLRTAAALAAARPA